MTPIPQYTKDRVIQALAEFFDDGAYPADVVPLVRQAWVDHRDSADQVAAADLEKLDRATAR